MDEKQLFGEILKIFEENAIEKLNFELFLGNFVTKNRNFGNSIIFLQQFFSGWGVVPPNPPCVRHWGFTQNTLATPMNFIIVCFEIINLERIEESSEQ